MRDVSQAPSARDQSRTDPDPEFHNVGQRSPPRGELCHGQFSNSEVLRDEGYETATAKDGHAAIQRLTAGLSPDVIVLDLEMPYVNGLEFLGWVKQNGIEIPIVLSTLADEYKGPELGAVAKLSKPFTLEQLLDGIAVGLKAKPRRN